MTDTSIPVSDGVWDELNDRKSRGQTYDELLRDLLVMNETAHAAHAGAGDRDD